MKHDCVKYQHEAAMLFVIGAKVEATALSCGFIYVNNLDSTEVLLSSDTGYSYLVKIPDTYLGLKHSCQFNVVLSLKK